LSILINRRITLPSDGSVSCDVARPPVREDVG
jgi:hypothetical protein